jgi:hypothetical protein
VSIQPRPESAPWIKLRRLVVRLDGELDLSWPNPTLSRNRQNKTFQNEEKAGKMLSARDGKFQHPLV